MSDRLFDLHSRRDDRGQCHLLDARLMLGDGTAIVFTAGIARNVPEKQARLLRHRKDLIISPADVADPFGDDEVFADDPQEAQEAPVEPADADPDPQAASDDPDVQAALDAAREHLEAEGLSAPDPEAKPELVSIPEGFTATTDDGEARCLAAKGDGTQCLNAAIEDTRACGLKPHKDKLGVQDA